MDRERAERKLACCLSLAGNLAAEESHWSENNRLRDWRELVADNAEDTQYWRAMATAHYPIYDR